MKMKEAARLLSEGRLSVKEVAARTGFNSPQYFCRSFRAYFGRSPLER
jgi:AraC-like DNA-binding protein